MYLTALTPEIFTLALPNSQALMMGLAGVRCWNIQDRNACNCSLIGSELLQLVASPTMQIAPLSFSDLRCVADASQILKRNGCIQLFSFLYQLFRDVVVNPLLKASFSPREPFQEAFCPFVPLD